MSLQSDPSLSSRRDSDDRLPIHWATCTNRLETVSLLCDRPDFSPDTPDGAGWTCLMMASSLPDSEGLPLVRIFLSRGADPNAVTNTGATALHFASSKGNIDVVRALLGEEGNSDGTRDGMGRVGDRERNVDHGRKSILIRDQRGRRPLHRAAAVGCEPIVRLLIEGLGRAAVESVDVDGLSALHHAVAEGHGETAMILLRAGARLRKKDDGRDPLSDTHPDPMVIAYIKRKAEEEGITVVADD